MLVTVWRSSLRDPAARSVAVRLTLASMIAMSTAALMGLALPWWAAMAVWMVGQPPRGLLFERSLAQLVGTVIGASAGALLVILGDGSEVVTLLGLALWIGICCGLANMMRHQRAYGAVLCGLTSVVIVALTTGTTVDPVAFAVARAMDNLIGVAAALGVALVIGPAAIVSTVASRAQTVMGQTLNLIADALTEPQDKTITKEREFLLALASLEASAEDAAAGSFAARRELRDIKGLFACLLDLLVVARAIRSQEAFGRLQDHTDLLRLKAAIAAAASDLSASRALDVGEALAASHKLEAADSSLASVLGEMRDLLERIAKGYERLWSERRSFVERNYTPHPDTTGLKRAAGRGGLVTLVAGLLFLTLDGGPLRYLMLGAGIFTVLFSVVDDPAPAVRQVFLGGLAASVAAVIWRLGVMPEVASGWLSLLLATPLVFGACLLQAERSTMFIGLAFNMLFAVLARPIESGPDVGSVMIINEAMLLAGIGLNYAFFRWIFPMNTGRRRMHLKSAVQREIRAIAANAGTPRAPHHLARLRYLVLGLAVRSGGKVQELEGALSALALGHAILRLGELAATTDLADINRDAIRKALHMMQRAPLHHDQLRQDICIQASRIIPSDDKSASLPWLLEVMTMEFGPAMGVGIHTSTRAAQR